MELARIVDDVIASLASRPVDARTASMTRCGRLSRKASPEVEHDPFLAALVMSD